MSGWEAHLVNRIPVRTHAMTMAASKAFWTRPTLLQIVFIFSNSLYHLSVNQNPVTVYALNLHSHCFFIGLNEFITNTHEHLKADVRLGHIRHNRINILLFAT